MLEHPVVILPNTKLEYYRILKKIRGIPHSRNFKPAAFQPKNNLAATMHHITASAQFSRLRMDSHAD
jgi:hypothetical protein